MLHRALSERSREADCVFVGAAGALVVILPVPVAAAAFNLQRRLQPPDSVLFGSVQIGEMMFAVPAMLIGLVPSIAAARALTRELYRSDRLWNSR
jgi:hypothetical protein